MAMSKKRAGKGNGKKKAEQRLEAARKKDVQKKFFFAAVGAVILVLIIIGIILIFRGGESTDIGYEDSEVDADNENVVISISEVSDGDFHYYNFNDGGTHIKYFVVKGGDGQVHTAFDACDVCYRAGKGYSQDGDEARCNNCGLTYPVDDLGTKNVGGGCWPGMLPHTIKEGKIYIRISDLKAGNYYFE